MQRTIGTGVRAPAFDPAMIQAPERLRDALRAHHGAEPPRPSRGAAADPSPARPFDGAQAIMWEAALSFLGLGVQPPAPSFGSMLREAQSYLSIQPSLAIITGVAVSAIVLGLNLLGDALGDFYDLAGR